MLTREQALLLDKHHDRETRGVEAAEARALLEVNPDARRYLADLEFLHDTLALPSHIDREGLGEAAIHARIMAEIEARTELEEATSAILTAGFRRECEEPADPALLARIMAGVAAQTEQRERVAAAATSSDSFLDRLRNWGSGWAFTGAVAVAAALLAVTLSDRLSPAAPESAQTDPAKTTIINNYYVQAPRVDSLTPTSGFTASVTQGSQADDTATVIWLQPNGTLATAPKGNGPASKDPTLAGSGASPALPVHTD